jgi:hydrogenase maturation protease
MSLAKNILILGLGNDYLGDDAVGLRIVRELRRRLGEKGSGVDLLEAGAGGMTLLDLMTGYRGLILIDAIQTGNSETGRIYRLTENQLTDAMQGDSAAPWSVHHMGLRQVLETGRRAGCSLPEKVVVYAVETDTPQEWRHGCSRRVEEAIPEVVRRVIGEIPAMAETAGQRRGSH